VKQLAELEWLGSERLERWERFADWLALGHARRLVSPLVTQQKFLLRLG